MMYDTYHGDRVKNMNTILPVIGRRHFIKWLACGSGGAAVYLFHHRGGDAKNTGVEKKGTVKEAMFYKKIDRSLVL